MRMSTGWLSKDTLQLLSISIGGPNCLGISLLFPLCGVLQPTVTDIWVQASSMLIGLI